jgi:hypothetical protein
MKGFKMKTVYLFGQITPTDRIKLKIDFQVCGFETVSLSVSEPYYLMYNNFSEPL